MRQRERKRETERESMVEESTEKRESACLLLGYTVKRLYGCLSGSPWCFIAAAISRLHNEVNDKKELNLVAIMTAINYSLHIGVGEGGQERHGCPVYVCVCVRLCVYLYVLVCVHVCVCHTSL